MRDSERRVAMVEIRMAAQPDGKPPMLSGHAAKFDSLSEDLGGFRERIAPGAFAKSLQSSDVRCLWNHDANIVLGRNKSGTLRMSEDTAGLYYECDIPDTQLIRDMVAAPIARGDVNQCSFGFYTINDKWQKIDGEWIRTLLECDLLDVSPVTYPAYPATDVAVRSLKKQIDPDAAVREAARANEVLRRRLALAG